MDIWIVLEILNTDEGLEHYTTAHLTKKGAYIAGWKLLKSQYRDAFGFEDEVSLLNDEQGDLLDSILKTKDLNNFPLEELENSFIEIGYHISAALDWNFEVAINKCKAFS